MPSIRQRGAGAQSPRETKLWDSNSSLGNLSEEMFDVKIGKHPNDVKAADLHFVSTVTPTAYLSRPPVMIPDKYYRDYMMGRSSKRKPKSFDGKACAHRCAGFSVVGVLFLLMVGYLIDTQSFYIKGVQPTGEGRIEGVTYGVTTKYQELPATANAYKASFAYFVTILLCMAYSWNLFATLQTKLMQSRMRRQQYQTIPDTTLPLFHVPDAHDAYSSTGSELWNRLLLNVKKLTKSTQPSARGRKKGRDD